MANDGYEVDFLQVGSGERGGDAIAIRLGDLYGHRSNQFVMVVDGGTQESGANLVSHIKKYYDTDIVDAVVSTHPDNDHICGLATVLEELTVKKLYMHRPWAHASKYVNFFKDGRITPNSLEERLEKSLNQASDLESIAVKYGIPIVEPFSDQPAVESRILILGPSRHFYENQIAQFRSTPEPKTKAASLLAQLAERAIEVVSKVAEKWDIETLIDPSEGATSAENNSSVILYMEISEKKILLTADAGVPALEDASRKLGELGGNWDNLSFIQVPHHGSKRNVGPTILNEIIGPIRSDKGHVRTAFISCPPDGNPKHPAKKVVNAFIRRGCLVIATQGEGKRAHFNAPGREGWSAATPLPFYDEVDE